MLEGAGREPEDTRTRDVESRSLMRHRDQVEHLEIVDEGIEPREKQ